MESKKQEKRVVSVNKLKQNFEHTILTLPVKHISRGYEEHISIKLIRSFNHWLKIPDSILQDIAEITGMVQIAGLLVDDIQDNTLVRHGIPTAHIVYGLPITINSAYYVTFLAMQKCIDLKHPEAIKLFTYYVMEITVGQGMEIYWRDNLICPNEDKYLRNAIKKTASLFLFAIELMQEFSENKTDFTKLIELLGCHYQIFDDYVNLCSESYHKTKTFCEDMTEGKFSFPILHAIHSKPDDSRVMNIIRQKPTNEEIKKFCLTLLNEFGSIEYTKLKMDELHEQALKQIEMLGGNPDLIDILDTIFKENMADPNN